MQNQLLTYVVILMFLEIYEASWQRGENLREYIASMYAVYGQSVAAFLLRHPSFYLILFLAISMEENYLLWTLLGVKTLDIVLKISLLDKIKNGEELGAFAPMLEQDIQVSPYLRYLGAVLYPTFLYLCFA